MRNPPMLVVFMIYFGVSVASLGASVMAPKVLLIGDSVSVGYAPTVRARLADFATVFEPINEDGTRQNASSTRTPKQGGPPLWANLDRWLNQQPSWDVIHFNFGLHDIVRTNPETEEYDLVDGVCKVPVAEYRANLQEIHNRMVTHSPGAAIVWASTTPVPPCCCNRREGDAAVYNTEAAEVMDMLEVPVDDLYSLIYSDPRNLYVEPGNVHFSLAGYQLLGNQVADEVLTVIPQPIPGDANSDGVVSDADYTIWADNHGAAGATSDMGDINGDGAVTDADYTVWADNHGVAGATFNTGDINGDGGVTDADYTIWADNYGADGATFDMGDFNGDGGVTDADYTIWADNYGATAGSVPEPMTGVLCLVSSMVLLMGRHKGR
jgi:lysophospholipase L1-like esterase